MALAIFLLIVETPSDYCYRVTISVLCLLCCPIPCGVKGTPPYFAILRSASATSPYVPFLFWFCDLLVLVLLVLISIILFWPFFLRLPFGSLVSSVATSWTWKCWFCFVLFCFFQLCVPALFFFFSCLPPGRGVSSFCWSINWTHHGTDRTTKEQPCPLGTRPAPLVHARFRFSFLFFFKFISFLFLFFLFLSVSFLFYPCFCLLSGVRIIRVYHGYVLLVLFIPLHMTRDGR